TYERQQAGAQDFKVHPATHTSYLCANPAEMPSDAVAEASDALANAIDKEENVLFLMRYLEL
ncbi:hypothetical protein MY5147_003819, partial [Beauveria neobassiana]